MYSVAVVFEDGIPTMRFFAAEKLITFKLAAVCGTIRARTQQIWIRRRRFCISRLQLWQRPAIHMGRRIILRPGCVCSHD